MSSLQQFCGGVVENATDFGSDIQRFFKANMHHIVSEIGCGWMDGGCLTAALAIKGWIGEDAEIYALCRDSGVVDHVAVRLCGQDLYIDADGLCRGSELVEKMRRVEMAHWNLSLLPFVSVADNSSLESYPKIISLLTRGLRNKFGAWPDAKHQIEHCFDDGYSQVLIGPNQPRQ